MEQEPNYMKGFNDGYKLAKFQPELFAKVQNSLSDKNDYERGVIEGAKEFEKEKEVLRTDDLKQVRDSKTQSKETERTK